MICIKEGEQTWKEYKEPEPIIPDVRMRELAESAISYLYDEDMLRDFLEDRYMELSDEEADYFGVFVGDFYDEEN